MAYHGVNQQELNDFLKVMVTGVQAGIIQEDMRRIDLMVKGDKSLQNSLDKLQKLYYPLENGQSIPLSNFVQFISNAGPVQIEHEHGYRKTIVQTNVEDRDLVSFVEEAKKKIETVEDGD